MIRDLRTPLLLATLASAAACGGSSDAAPVAPEPGVLLVVDGDIVVRKEDIAPYSAYFESLDPTMGVKYRTRELLQQHLLPLMLARRTFAAERAELRARAAELREFADNSIELRRRGELMGIEAPDQPFTRNDLPLPVAMWAFRPENLGAVSPPIETPRGYVLVAPIDLEPGLTPVGDRLRAFLVPFHTHDADAFDAWLATAREAVAGHVEFVDESLEDALPAWLLKS